MRPRVDGDRARAIGRSRSGRRRGERRRRGAPRARRRSRGAEARASAAAACFRRVRLCVNRPSRRRQRGRAPGVGQRRRASRWPLGRARGWIHVPTRGSRRALSANVGHAASKSRSCHLPRAPGGTAPWQPPGPRDCDSGRRGSAAPRRSRTRRREDRGVLVTGSSRGRGAEPMGWGWRLRSGGRRARRSGARLRRRACDAVGRSSRDPGCAAVAAAGTAMELDASEAAGGGRRGRNRAGERQATGAGPQRSTPRARRSSAGALGR